MPLQEQVSVEKDLQSNSKQNIPCYSGFQSCLLPYTQKSKAYYHVTYNEPPKKSIIYDVMNKLFDAMKDKGIPFSFLVGDLATYKFILGLKTENLDAHPFDESVPELRLLQSSVTASPEVLEDLWNALEQGEK